MCLATCKYRWWRALHLAHHYSWPYYYGLWRYCCLKSWKKLGCECRLRPRILVDVSNIDLTTSVLGLQLAMPIMVAPTALHRLAHPQGKLIPESASSRCFLKLHLILQHHNGLRIHPKKILTFYKSCNHSRANRKAGFNYRNYVLIMLFFSFHIYSSTPLLCTWMEISITI